MWSVYRIQKIDLLPDNGTVEGFKDQRASTCWSLSERSTIVTIAVPDDFVDAVSIQVTENGGFSDVERLFEDVRIVRGIVRIWRTGSNYGSRDTGTYV